MEARAIIEGRSRAGKKHFVWLRVPELWPNKGLMLQGTTDPLPHGFRTAYEVIIEVDPDSLRYDRWYTADLEFVRVLSRRPEEGPPAGANSA